MRVWSNCELVWKLVVKFIRPCEPSLLPIPSTYSTNSSICLFFRSGVGFNRKKNFLLKVGHLEFGVWGSFVPLNRTGTPCFPCESIIRHQGCWWEVEGTVPQPSTKLSKYPIILSNDASSVNLEAGANPKWEL